MSNRTLLKLVLKMGLCSLLSSISSLVWCCCFTAELGIPLLVKVSTTIKFNTEDFSLGFTDTWLHIHTKEASFQRTVFWNTLIKPKSHKIIKYSIFPWYWWLNWKLTYPGLLMIGKTKLDDWVLHSRSLYYQHSRHPVVWHSAETRWVYRITDKVLMS